jgi:hypothetical protein
LVPYAEVLTPLKKAETLKAEMLKAERHKEER